MKAKYLATILCCCLILPAEAMITQHGKEPVHSPSWVPGLDDIINHPARVSGMSGPYGPTATFQYAGSTDTLNEILGLYAKVKQAHKIVYLSAEQSDTPFELSVTHEGAGFLRVYVQGGITLEKLKTPDGVAVESLPEASAPLDPGRLEEQRKARKQIDEFISARKRLR